jgi:hypothetical protein
MIKSRTHLINHVHKPLHVKVLDETVRVVDSAGSRYVPVGGCYEHGNELSASVNAVEFCFSFVKYQFLNRNATQYIYLTVWLVPTFCM